MPLKDLIAEIATYVWLITMAIKHKGVKKRDISRKNMTQIIHKNFLVTICSNNIGKSNNFVRSKKVMQFMKHLDWFNFSVRVREIGMEIDTKLCSNTKGSHKKKIVFTPLPHPLLSGRATKKIWNYLISNPIKSFIGLTFSFYFCLQSKFQIRIIFL